jgi:hypothetical protein
MDILSEESVKRAVSPRDTDAWRKIGEVSRGAGGAYR